MGMPDKKMNLQRKIHKIILDVSRDLRYRGYHIHDALSEVDANLHIRFKHGETFARDFRPVDRTIAISKLICLSPNDMSKFLDDTIHDMFVEYKRNKFAKLYGKTDKFKDGVPKDVEPEVEDEPVKMIGVDPAENSREIRIKSVSLHEIAFKEYHKVMHAGQKELLDKVLLHAAQPVMSAGKTVVLTERDKAMHRAMSFSTMDKPMTHMMGAGYQSKLYDGEFPEDA